MAANVESLRTRRIVVWGKHGVMARSNQSVTRAVDRIEYAETAARYEYMDLLAGGRGEGLTRRRDALGQGGLQRRHRPRLGRRRWRPLGPRDADGQLRVDTGVRER